MVKLSPTMQKFILHWGEMGTRWGVNRTVAQIHALLYVSEEPLNAEEIARTLSVARSNVSTSLKELQGWGIIRIVHRLGDRRDYYQSMDDVWEMFRIIMDERKRREMDPTIEVLRSCVEEMDADKAASRHTRRRLEDMLDFFETNVSFYQRVRDLPTGTLRKFAKMGERAGKVLMAATGKKKGK